MKFCLVFFFLTLSIFSQINDHVSYSIVREGSEESSGSPSHLELHLTSGDIGSFDIYFNEKGLLISYFDTKKDLEVSYEVYDVAEFINNFDLVSETFPIYHDYNSDGYKDYAFHFAHQVRGDKAVILLFEPSTESYRLLDVGLGSRSFSFQPETNVLSHADWHYGGDLGFVSSIRYMLCVGQEWIEIGTLDYSNYHGAFHVLQHGLKAKVHLNRNSWLRSHGHYFKEERKVLETGAWAQEHVLKYWLPRDSEAETLSDNILQNRIIPKVFSKFSKDALQLIFSKIVQTEIGENIRERFRDLIQASHSVVMPSYLFHKVKGGETLFGISQAYKISLRTLREINNIDFSNVIYAGEELVVPNPNKE